MTGCPSDNRLAELVDGSLAEPERAEVERHLDACAPCSQLAAELAWLVGDVAAAPAGYRFVRQLSPEVFEAITPAGRPVIVECGDVDPRLAAVDHPAVAPILELGEGFVAYERLTTTLREWAADQPPERRLAAWLQVLRGLAAIHRAGAVHGRISPDHVFVVRERAVIAGFARPLARTAGYLAPELLEGKPPSARADQLAACVALYEALAGKRPFAGATAGALAVAMATPPPPPPGIERHHAAAIVRGMARDPAARFPEVAALIAELERPAPDWTPWLVVAVAAVAVAAVVWVVA